MITNASNFPRYLSYKVVVFQWCEPKIKNSFPSRTLLDQSQHWKHQSSVWNLFNVNDRHQNNFTDVVFVSLFTLNWFHILFCCFPISEVKPAVLKYLGMRNHLYYVSHRREVGVIMSYSSYYLFNLIKYC